jgi:UDP-N-acetylmuramyl-tripeptide synthetase
LSRDHMDYHATVEDYLAAKLRLFRDLLPDGAPAIVDADAEVAPRAIEAASARGLAVFSVGAKGKGIRLAAVAREGLASTLALEFGGRKRRVRLPLPGDFQISNALVAAGLCVATGSEADAVFHALEGLEGAPGRLERIGAIRGAAVFVDYAHKPDALEKALAALRPHLRGRLIVAFGCGGDRDPGKRPIMGEIAARAADVVIVTDDNPRSENPAAIRAQILAAAPAALEIGDRAQAIRAGVAMLEDGDALMIAGKGHETGQIVGDQVLPFSDADEARKALAEAE